MTLLEEAAAEYRKARADNDERDKLTAETLEPDHALRLEIRSERLEIARGLSVLAAIEAGCADVLPVTLDLDDRETGT
jgi:hypothetical protein